jgi:hypothetical protein
MSRAELAVFEADWLLSQGRPDEALTLLETTIAESAPGRLDLQRSVAHLRGDTVLGDLRVDPIEAIAEYREHAPEVTSDTIYALDYGAYRYFEDGSSISVTHQILHLLTRESLGDNGEVTIPRSAMLLRARTIKADGTILEPARVPGQDSVSMPNLEIGDFVEYEYVEVAGPSAIGAGTLLGSRFYFQIFDAPLSRSEMIVDVPRSWGDLMLDLRGGAPEPEVSEVGDFRRYRFLVMDSAPPVDEPSRPDADEFLPSVRVAHEYRWSAPRDFFVDRQAGVTRPTPDLVELTRALTAGADSERDAVHRIFRYVIDEIEETGGFLGTDAIWTLRLGAGERLPLLMTMLQAGGFDARMVFLRSWADDQTASVIPNADAYPHTVVSVQTGDDTVWLHASSDYSPFDYLRPDLQGVDGVVIAAGDDRSSPVAWITTPIWPDEYNVHRIDMSLIIEESGDVIGQVEERVPLSSAGGLRGSLERIQEEFVLVQQLEQGLAHSFPGAAVIDVEIEGTDRPDEALTIRYTFQADGFARIGPDGLVVDARVFDRQLRGMLGSQPTRIYPLSVDSPFGEEVVIEIELPAGYRLIESPEPVALDSEWIRYQWTTEISGATGGTLRLVRRTDMPVGRVEPEDYASFLDVLRQIDDAEALHLRAIR